MKDEINLLPEPAQHFRLSQLYFYRVGQIIRRFDIILIIILLVMGVVYGSILSLAKYSEHTTMTTTTTVDYTQQIKDANNLLHFVIQQNALRVSWMSQVADVIAQVPPGLQIQRLAVEPDTAILTVEGSYNDRATLINFENKLRTLSWVTAIDSPLSNFATGVQTGFTLKLSRKTT